MYFLSFKAANLRNSEWDKASVNGDTYWCVIILQPSFTGSLSIREEKGKGNFKKFQCRTWVSLWWRQCKHGRQRMAEKRFSYVPFYPESFPQARSSLHSLHNNFLGIVFSLGFMTDVKSPSFQMKWPQKYIS